MSRISETAPQISVSDVELLALEVLCIGPKEVLVQEVGGRPHVDPEGDLLWEYSVTGAKGSVWAIDPLMLSPEVLKSLARGGLLYYKSWRQKDSLGRNRRYVEYDMEP